MANCLIHADYAGHRSVRVVKRPGLFEFRNPGRMRVSVEQAIRGGESDCRNKILQNMFFLAGRGDRLGSGVPTIVQNWKGQHWRQPELLEELEPEDQTFLRLRMESLLPEDALHSVEARFGDRFRELDEVGRIALVTVAVEGFLTHGRLGQLCDRHANDLSRLLANLVQEGFLESDRRGRGTSYRFPGTGEQQVVDGEWASRQPTGHGGGMDSPPSSPHSDLSSPHSGSGSPQLQPALPANQPPEEDPSLLASAEHVRKGRVREAELRAVILILCEGRFLTLQQLAALMGRAAKGLRDRYLSPMIMTGQLEWRFPNSPNHESQAYRTLRKAVEPGAKKSSSEKT